MQTSMESIATFNKINKKTTLSLSGNNFLPCIQRLAMLLIGVASLQCLAILLINVDKIISSNPEKYGGEIIPMSHLIPKKKR